MSFIIADNIISSLGTSTEEVLANIESGLTGITSNEYSHLTAAPISLINREKLFLNNSFEDKGNYTFFEQIAIISISAVLTQTKVKLDSKDTLLIVSTTKGNIELLEKDVKLEDGLIASGVKNIADFFNCANPPQIVCNACISGILAMIVGDRYINSGKYKNVVIAGADIVSEFVVAGFESFKSMSNIPCQPFDRNRSGLSLGEGVGTIVLSNEPENFGHKIEIVGGSSANDANHISGPSRTGEGAFLSASRALKGRKDIDFISAHGTATPYNDDMESVALTRLGLQDVPVNSFKGYFGHTLGAAGIIESILTVHSMKQNKVFGTKGLKEPGVVEPLNIVDKHINKKLNRCLKIASGFGGCNAAIVFEKNA